MKLISKVLGNIIMIAYGILCMPLLILLAIMFPIVTLMQGGEIISTGYTIYGEYITLIIGMLTIMYFSLRVRAIRRIYVIFPSLYETLKYLVISSIFIGVGAEILNWSYTILTPTRKVFGIASFIIAIILWRVFVALLYKKKPVSKVMLQKTEKLQNYCDEIN